MRFFDNLWSFLSLHSYFISNSSIVFLLGGVYSYVELLQITSKASQIWKIQWGWIYILGNAFVSVLALVVGFSDEVDTKFLYGKLLIAGTSGIALLRVISINTKERGVEDRSYTIIQILQKRIFNEYDRKRSTIDLPRLKKIMEPFDNHSVIADNLPFLFSNLMRTLTPEEHKALARECEEFKQIKDGNEKIKCINLGAIIARYVGMPLLESTLSELQEYLTNNSSQSVGSEEKNIDDYLKEFS